MATARASCQRLLRWQKDGYLSCGGLQVKRNRALARFKELHWQSPEAVPILLRFLQRVLSVRRLWLPSVAVEGVKQN